MELQFSWPRVLIFVVLMGGVFLLGGFSDPQQFAATESLGSIRDMANMMRMWFISMALVVIGAAVMIFVEHEIGGFESINLKFLYVLGGLAMIGAGGVLNLRLHETAPM